jgi:DNA helicase-2/ATP-dependent DNA helicase PcrA
VTTETVQKIERVRAMIAKHAETARQKPVREIILAFLEESGILKSITDEETAEDHETVGFLNQFWKRIEVFEESADEPTVKRFLEIITLEREAGEEGALPADPNAGPEAVRVLTVHAAKGLEFRYVFIVNLIEQRFPSMDRSDPIELPVVLTKVIVPEGDAHIAEERRLFYVACTRAKEGLYLSYADDYGGSRKRKPSRFLAELEIGEMQNAKCKMQNAPHSRAVASMIRDHQAPIRAPSVGIAHALPAKLSFTQIKAYQTCPWQYHYAHVLRVPIRGRFVFSFGQTMHVTLQRFFEQMRERSSVRQEEVRP